MNMSTPLSNKTFTNRDNRYTTLAKLNNQTNYKKSNLIKSP